MLSSNLQSDVILDYALLVK